MYVSRGCIPGQSKRPVFLCWAPSFVQPPGFELLQGNGKVFSTPWSGARVGMARARRQNVVRARDRLSWRRKEGTKQANGALVLWCFAMRKGNPRKSVLKNVFITCLFLSFPRAVTSAVMEHIYQRARPPSILRGILKLLAGLSGCTLPFTCALLRVCFLVFSESAFFDHGEPVYARPTTPTLLLAPRCMQLHRKIGL